MPRLGSATAVAAAAVGTVLLAPAPCSAAKVLLVVPPPAATVLRSSAPSPGASRSEKAEFQRRANRICETATSLVTPVVAVLMRGSFTPDVEAEWVRAKRKEVQDLAALVPPPAFAVRYGRMLDVSRAAITAGQRVFDALLSHDTVGFPVFVDRAADLDAARTQLAIAMGLPACERH